MSENTEITLGMKFYPYLVMKGIMLRLSNNRLKASFDKSFKRDLVKYFPKSVVIRLTDENKIKTLGEGNLVDIKDTDGNNMIVEILLEDHTILNMDLLNKYSE
jgi:hypothetical protein